MSPFLPPYQQYDFGPVHSPPIQHNEEVEDNACSSTIIAPESPKAYADIVEQVSDTMMTEQEEQEAGSGQDAIHSSLTIKEKVDTKDSQPRFRTLTLRKRNITATTRSTSVSSSIKRQSIQDNPPSTATSKTTVNTITLDRFSACIPCRKRKIKCIPKGDSHHYLSDGTNNGVCATCIRRKKDCFWPKIDVTSSVKSTPASPSYQQEEEVSSATIEEEGEIDQSCKEENGKENIKCEDIDKKMEEATVPLPSVNEEERAEEETPLILSPLSTAFGDAFFGIPGQGFGRIMSTPALSPSSSSSSSSSSSPSPSSSSSSSSPSPVSPRTDASFLSPTLSDSFFFEDAKVARHSSPVSYLDTLHQALQSETLFADGYYSL